MCATEVMIRWKRSLFVKHGDERDEWQDPVSHFDSDV